MRTDALVVLALASTSLAFAADTPSISCAVTQPITAEPPRDPSADAFGPGPWYINQDRTIWAVPTQFGEGGNKVLWIRPRGTQLSISGRRLDREAPPLTARIPCCYRTGFQATGLTFPSPGCWEVKATAGASTLTFVTDVKARHSPGGAAEQPLAPTKQAPSPKPPALAGQYCSGDGLSSTLRLTIGAADYEFSWGTDVPGSKPARATGEVHATGSVVKLEPAPFQFPGVYQAVKWGSRTYLVPEGRLREFCASSIEPRRWCVGSFFVRTLDGAKPAGATTSKRPMVCGQSR